MAWNDPDEKRKILPAVSNPVTLLPSPRNYGAVRPEETTADYTLPSAPDLVSGPAKMVAGGLGAIPTAAGRAIEQIPAGVGNLIGAVPINPADYGVNKALDLAGEGVTETVGGLKRLGSAVRTGAMNLFGLKEAPSAPSPLSAPVTSPLPAAAQPFAPSAGGIPDKTREQFMTDITNTRAPASPTTLTEPAGRGISGRITMGDKTIEVPRSAPETSVAPVSSVTSPAGVTVPAAAAPVRDYNAEIDNLVNQLMGDSRNLVTQRMSGGGTVTGGLKKNVLNQVIELRKAQLGLQGQLTGAQSASEDRKLTAQVGLEGHKLGLQGQREVAASHLAGTKITAEASKAGHKATAEAAMDWRNASLEERKRQNDILAQQHTLALQDRKDVAEQKAMESVLNRFAVHEADPLNPTDKAVNMRHTYFNVWDSGTKPHAAIADAVTQMGDQFKAYRENTMKLSKVKELTPEQEKQIKARFRKSLSLYPDIAPVK